MSVSLSLSFSLYNSFVFIWSTFAPYTRSSGVIHLCPSLFVPLSFVVFDSLPLFVSQVLSFSGLLPSDTISSLYLLLNYSKASIPEECFRMLVEENAIKRKKLREWGSDWERRCHLKEKMLMRWLTLYRRTKGGSTDRQVSWRKCTKLLNDTREKKKHKEKKKADDW